MTIKHWIEKLHPRRPDGEFAPKGSGGGGRKAGPDWAGRVSESVGSRFPGAERAGRDVGAGVRPEIGRGHRVDTPDGPGVVARRYRYGGMEMAKVKYHEPLDHPALDRPQTHGDYEVRDLRRLDTAGAPAIRGGRGYTPGSLRADAGEGSAAGSLQNPDLFSRAFRSTDPNDPHAAEIERRFGAGANERLAEHFSSVNAGHSDMQRAAYNETDRLVRVASAVSTSDQARQAERAWRAADPEGYAQALRLVNNIDKHQIRQWGTNTQIRFFEDIQWAIGAAEQHGATDLAAKLKAQERLALDTVRH